MQSRFHSDGHGLVVDDGVHEGRHLARIRLHIPFEEEIQRFLGGDAVCVGDDRAGLGVVGDCHLPFAAEGFEALVVAVGRPAAVVDDGDCAAFETEGYHRCVDVARFAYSGVDGHAADGIDLVHLVTRNKPHHIEVVYGHIEEDSAADFDVEHGRRAGVAGSDFEDGEVADFTVCDGFARGGEIVVEAAVEAHLILDIRAFQRVHDRLDFAEVVVDGFLAEDVLARGDCLKGNGRMGVRGRTDEHGVYFGVGKDFLIVLARLFHAHGLCPCGGLLGHKGVGNGLDRGARDITHNRLGVDFAYSARADDTYFQHNSS